VQTFEALMLPLAIHPARCVADIDVSSRYGIETDDYGRPPLQWMNATYSIDVDAKHLAVCGECGKFADKAWQLNNLKVSRKDAESLGVFKLTQNRGQPTFVTEATKVLLENLGVRGIGFYNAGHMEEDCIDVDSQGNAL